MYAIPFNTNGFVFLFLTFFFFGATLYLMSIINPTAIVQVILILRIHINKQPWTASHPVLSTIALNVATKNFNRCVHFQFTCIHAMRYSPVRRVTTL
jgi:hypothetical protein